jgi:hypothetical protein
VEENAILFTPVRAHRFEHVERGDGVLLQIALGVLGAEAHVGVGGEMKHEARAFHGARQRVGIEQVAFKKIEVGVAGRIVEKAHAAGRQVVEADDALTVRQKAIGQLAADEACRSGNEVGHGGFVLLGAEQCKGIIRADQRGARALQGACRSPANHRSGTRR